MANPREELQNVLEALDQPWNDAVLERFESIAMPVEVTAGDYAHYSQSEAEEGNRFGGNDSVH